MVIGCEGDIGDSIVLLGIIAQIPNGPHTLLFEPSGCTKFRTPEAAKRLADIVAPLALSQPYIAECRAVREGDKIDWHHGHFRGHGYTRGQSLFDAHLANLIEEHGIGRGITPHMPWLKVEPTEESKGRIIISRTGRYRNELFPWRAVVEKYGPRLLFLGVPHEHRDFSGQFGQVEWRHTTNMLEVAELIAGSLLFIGNQSSPNAVAEGLKHRSIQETSLQYPDCIYHRPNAEHITDGSCVLPDFDGGQETVIVRANISISTQMSPPGNWQYPGCGSKITFELMKNRMKEEPEFADKTDAQIGDTLISYTLSRCPGWQSNGQSDAAAVAKMNAMESAQTWASRA